MPANMEKTEMGARLTLSGVVEISESVELKGQLAELLEGGDPVFFALAPDAELDITAIQLLEAARREARRRGQSFSFEGVVPPAVQGMLEEAGLGSLALFSASDADSGVEACQP